MFRVRLSGAIRRLRLGRVGLMRRWAGILAAAYLAVTVTTALLLWGFGDAWWPATFLLFSGRWVLLLPLVLLVPLGLLLLHPRALLTLGTGALVVVFPIMGLRVHRVPSDRDILLTPGHLRIVTLNTSNSGRIAHDLPALLEEWKPDVVAFQECGSSVAEAVRGLRGWHRDANDPLCLLSRFPIARAEAMDRSDLAGIHAASAIGGAGHVVRYTLQLPGGAVRFTNIHLETARKGFEGAMRGEVRQLLGNTELRAIEARLASRWAADGGAPDLVAGDFNTPVESRIYRSAWGSLRNAFSSVGSGFGYTRHNGWISVRIDHVLVGSGWRPLRAVVGEDVGSDHLPLIVDIAPRHR